VDTPQNVKTLHSAVAIATAQCRSAIGVWWASRGREIPAGIRVHAPGSAPKHLTLHTGAYNASARAFYAAPGFAEEEVRLTRPVPPA
jgi:hypothetical protein